MINFPDEGFAQRARRHRLEVRELLAHQKQEREAELHLNVQLNVHLAIIDDHRPPRRVSQGGGRFFVGLCISIVMIIFFASVPSAGASEVTITQIGAWGGSVDAIDIHQYGEQRIAYIGSGVRVVILDVTDPGNIIELGSVMLDSAVFDLKVRDGYAYVGAKRLEEESPASEFCVIDVHDPTAPFLVAGGIPGSRNAGGLFSRLILEDDRPIAYVTPPGSQTMKIDISDPTAPVYKSGTEGLAEPVMSGSLMYSLKWQSGEVFVHDTSTLDLDDPATGFERLGSVAIPDYRNASVSGSALAGDYLYVGAFALTQVAPIVFHSLIFVVDLSDPTAPVHVGTWGDPTGQELAGFAGAIAVSEGRLYWAGSGRLDPSSRTLVILDIATDPTNPTLIGQYSSAAKFSEIEVVGTTAYLGDSREGLTIVDCSDPGNPQRVGNYYSPKNFQQGALSGTNLYVTDPSYGLSILDVSAAGKPRLVGKWETGTYNENRERMLNWGIAVRDGLAYLAAGFAGLQVVDVSDPASPTLTGEFSPWPVGVRSVGLTLSPDEPIVHVGIVSGAWIVNFEVSDPSNIVDVGSVFIGGTNNEPRSIERRSDGIAYVTRGGMVVTLDLSDPTNPALLDEFRLGIGNPLMFDLVADGDLLYTANSYPGGGPEASGLDVLNTDPWPVPPPLAHYGSDVNGVKLRCFSVAAANGLTYAAFFPLNLHVLDMSSPAFPVLLGKAPSGGALVNDLIVDGNIVYAITRVSNGGAAGVLVYRLGSTTTTIDKNRYVSFIPSEPGAVAYKLEMVSSLFHPTATVSGWVGAPDADGISSIVPDLVNRMWTEAVVDITGCEITPDAVFHLRASTDGGATFLPPTFLQTTAQPRGGKWWGDTVGSFDGTEWSAPQGVVNIDDAVGAIKTWQGAAGAPEVPRTDVEPQEPNRVVNFNDVFALILAFQGDPYPFGCPADPCRDNVANPCQ